MSMKMFVLSWAILLLVSAPFSYAIENGTVDGEINSVQNFFESENGTGSEVNIESSITISGEMVQPLNEAVADYNFDVNQKKGRDEFSSWSYSNPSQKLNFSGLEGSLKKIKLLQIDRNTSTSDGGRNGGSKAEAKQKISGNTITTDPNLSVSISGDIVTVTWHKITYEDHYGQAVNSGAQATVESRVTSSNPEFTPATAMNINLKSTSRAYSPNGVLSASGTMKANSIVNGSLPSTVYKTETNASVFGSGTFHFGSASVKFSKSH